MSGQTCSSSCFSSLFSFLLWINSGFVSRIRLRDSPTNLLVFHLRKPYEQIFGEWPTHIRSHALCIVFERGATSSLRPYENVLKTVFVNVIEWIKNSRDGQEITKSINTGNTVRLDSARCAFNCFTKEREWPTKELMATHSCYHKIVSCVHQTMNNSMNKPSACIAEASSYVRVYGTSVPICTPTNTLSWSVNALADYISTVGY